MYFPLPTMVDPPDFCIKSFIQQLSFLRHMPRHGDCLNYSCPNGLLAETAVVLSIINDIFWFLETEEKHLNYKKDVNNSFAVYHAPRGRTGFRVENTLGVSSLMWFTIHQSDSD